MLEYVVKELKNQVRCFHWLLEPLESKQPERYSSVSFTASLADKGRYRRPILGIITKIHKSDNQHGCPCTSTWMGMVAIPCTNIHWWLAQQHTPVRTYVLHSCCPPSVHCQLWHVQYLHPSTLADSPSTRRVMLEFGWPSTVWGTSFIGLLTLPRSWLSLTHLRLRMMQCRRLERCPRRWVRPKYHASFLVEIPPILGKKVNTSSITTEKQLAAIPKHTDWNTSSGSDGVADRVRVHD